MFYIIQKKTYLQEKAFFVFDNTLYLKDICIMKKAKIGTKI